jgi:hypothetical protein
MACSLRREKEEEATDLLTCNFRCCAHEETECLRRDAFLKI